MASKTPHALTIPNGRPATFQNKLRARIQAGVLVDRLHKCAAGEVELTAEQLRSHIFLLNKVLPDEKHEVDLAQKLQEIDGKIAAKKVEQEQD